MYKPSLFKAIAVALLLSIGGNAVAEDSDKEPTINSDLSEQLVGTWEGPLVMGSTMNFVYEFTEEEEGLAGRWQTKERQKWIEIQGLEVTSEGVFFIFETRPEIMEVTLELDEATGFLVGQAKFPSRETGIPMTVTKVSDDIANEE